MILIDTNVISELTKATPSPQVLTWLEENAPCLSLSTITLAELRYGIARLPKGRRKITLLDFWDETRRNFAGRTLSFDVQAAQRFGDLMARIEARGKRMTTADGQIAAIAKARDLALATRNTKDFRHTGLRILNPWNPCAD